jgi:hypothetical protein
VRDEYLKLAGDVRAQPPLAPERREALLKRVRARQERVAYHGYEEWIRAARPPEFV